ncbi:hypothetical protein PT974_06902 [Cladobotryum mycophilum]|uniref:Lytic polysaccharide monooxygenase n=1 Tax=Cladobotryum mycophilum TaxID=491253 RepID=A0ABR0SP08_9HYPO
MLSKIFAINSLVAVASAHILMTNPIPYGKSSLNNSPLDKTGSDFPCKQRPGVYDSEGAQNVYAQGSTQHLAFEGSAVHGGGSCQVSVTTDLHPDKNSVWRVIKSIEGGCPAKGQTGNMGSNANAQVPYTYDFTIPAELASGNYTIAWTWFNKIGNREMYMNCAPMTVTGSGGSDSFLNSLPNMFEANNGNDCITPDSKDVLFPNPGKYVAKFNGATDDFLLPTMPACMAQGGGNGGGAPAPTTAPGSYPTTALPSVPTQAPATSAPSVPGGVFITKPAGAPAPTQPAATQPAATQPAESEPAATSAPAPETSAPAPVPTSAPAPNPGSGSGSAGGFSAGTACASEGAWNCIDGTSFQRCGSGTWSTLIPMASGMKCSPGQASDLNIVSRKSRGALRRAHRARGHAHIHS